MVLRIQEVDMEPHMVPHIQEVDMEPHMVLHILLQVRQYFYQAKQAQWAQAGACLRYSLVRASSLYLFALYPH